MSGDGEGGKTTKRRRSSSLIYIEPQETIEQRSDQAALPNLNANWTNAKGERHSKGREMFAERFAYSKRESPSFFLSGRGGNILRQYDHLLILPTGAWTIHIVLIIVLKVFYDIIPGGQPGDIMDPNQYLLHVRLVSHVPLGSGCTFRIQRRCIR